MYRPKPVHFFVCLKVVFYVLGGVRSRNGVMALVCCSVVCTACVFLSTPCVELWLVCVLLLGFILSEKVCVKCLWCGFEDFFVKRRIFLSKNLVVKIKRYTFASQLRNATHWTFSSAGLEHLPYKQRVGGSNPSTSTEEEPAHCVGYFFLHKSSLSGCLMCPVQGAVCGKLCIYCEKVIKLNTLLINFMYVMSVYG